MATNVKPVKGISSARYEDLKSMLEDRRREIMSEVHEKIRDVRTESGHVKMSEVFDQGESSESDIQEDIEFALIQMKAETLTRINEALSRLDEGAYGYCYECGDVSLGGYIARNIDAGIRLLATTPIEPGERQSAAKSFMPSSLQ